MRILASLALGIAVAGCGTPPSPSSPSPQYASSSCDDWLTSMQPDDRLRAARFFVSTLSVTGVVPSPVDPDATAHSLVGSLTDYCQQPPRDIVAGLGHEALMLRTAAALLLQKPISA